MRRTRNPRYAPEFLERKLSPTAVAGVATYAQVVPLTMSASSTAYVTYNTTSPVPSGYPTSSIPEPAPTGPVQPA